MGPVTFISILTVVSFYSVQEEGSTVALFHYDGNDQETDSQNLGVLCPPALQVILL